MRLKATKTDGRRCTWPRDKETLEWQKCVDSLRSASDLTSDDHLQLLIRKGAEADAADNNDWTVLHTAVATGNLEIVEVRSALTAVRIKWFS